MTSFKFCKMHGLGNDFVVIDNINQTVDLNKDIIQKLADRRTGVGCDQVLVVGRHEEADFSYTIYNADGSQALHCGNGARCVARFIHEQGLSDKEALSLAMPKQTITTQIKDYEHITIAMGTPEFLPTFDIKHHSQDLTVYPVSLSNPHAILIQEATQNLNLDELGKMLNLHQNFSDGVNVTVIKKIAENAITIAVYERGVGPTQACGSAACASAALSFKNELTASPVKVIMPGGDCQVAWPDQEKSVYLTGPAVNVYQGTWYG